MRESELIGLRRQKLGFIFQSFGLLPLLSAPGKRGAAPAHRRRAARTPPPRAREVLELVGLERRAHHRPYELSGGEQQRVAIARALVTEPTLVLADEPTGELDSATATAVFTLIRDICRERGVSIITCTHDRLVMEMASRVEELEDGRLTTGHKGDVWGRVQSRDRTPFEAPEGESQESQSLPSLIGADTRNFGPRKPEPKPKPEEVEDIPEGRWSRPE